MKKIAKPLLTIFIFSLISFVICMIVGFCIFKPNDSFNHTFAIKCFDSFGLFGEVFPAIIFATFVVSFSLEFGSEKSSKNRRLSEHRMDCLRSVFVVALICSVCLFLYQELLIPATVAKKQKFENDYYATQKYYEQAKYDFSKNNLDYAQFYIEQALMIDPKEKSFTQLREKILLEKANQKRIRLEAEKNTEIIVDTKLISLNETDTSLLERARKAYQSKEYFDAHYYAINAERFAEKDSPNANYARMLASDAWNKISTDFDEYDSELQGFQATKKKAYIALLQGDYCESYYIFKNLLNDKNYNPSDDFDVKKYMDEAEANLKQQYFFIDEAIEMGDFESFNNVYFSVANDFGGKDVYFIAGISLLQDSGQLLQYCRDFTINSFDQDGNLISSLHTPYCKLFPKKGELFGLEHDYVPYIQLVALDRVSKDFRIEPTLNNMELKNSYLVLDMPFDDFNMLRQASRGSDQMPLSSMFRFSKSAKKYGFQDVEYSCSFASRLLYPLKAMILFMIFAIIAWKFRLMPGRKIQKVWYLTIPLFAALAYVALDLLAYFDAMNFFIINFSVGITTMVVLFFVYLFLIFCFSVWFACTKS